MPTRELHRGRLIDHIQLVVRDVAASRAFYEAVFEVLQIPMSGTGDGYFWADELFVSSADNEAAQGGKDNGAPGFREYHPGYDAGFVLDPDGNNIEAVFHGEARRSASSVEVTF